uniref:Receptor ligand binding region domain-containing protein n=1 Tax=Ditylenchus dipsaci TaxID=166011 RepID=A0A915DTP3_9BILA
MCSAIQNVFLLAHKNKALRTANGDTWGVMNKVCHEMKSGFMVMLTGESEQRPHEAYFSVSNSLEIPLVNWDSSPLLPAQIQSNSFEISLKPPTTKIIADLIVLKKWDNFIYLHDVENSDKASQNLQQIYSYLQTITNQSVSSEILQLPKDVADFGEFLQLFNLKRFLSESPVRMVLDTSTSYRQQQLLQAIRSAQFNQNNYHYVVANYDFHNYDIELFSIGNINITGFQIINRETREYSLLKNILNNTSLTTGMREVSIWRPNWLLYMMR